MMIAIRDLPSDLTFGPFTARGRSIPGSFSTDNWPVFAVHPFATACPARASLLC